jgi:HSP20 family protein
MNARFRLEEVKTMADKELKPTEKKEVRGVQPEETRGLPYFTPNVDIYETDSELIIVADMPGVEGKNIEIDLKEGALTLQGRVTPPEFTGFTPLYREYREGNFYRQFMLSEIVDQDKIAAEMFNGVLKVILPKVAKAQPRKITVKTT